MEQEFDLHTTVKSMLDENHVEPGFALKALLEGLIENHREVCDLRAEYGGTRENSASALEAVHAIMYAQWKRNRGIYERQTRDDEPNDSAWIAGMIFGQISHAQGVLSDIVHGCIEATNQRPVTDH